MTDVFISYAREDRSFVQRLHDALANEGRESWVDWEGIPASAKWMAEVRTAIDEADCFCFVVSPDSVESPVCREEAAHAAASNKRILPLVYREVPEGLVPETVAAHNWIDFDGTADFESGFAALVKALETEPEHLRTHTRLLVRAKEWEAVSHANSSLLRGQDLLQAEAWLSSAAGREPAPTQLHTTYVLASRKAASRRQRTVVGAVAVALVLSLVLSAVAIVQRGEAQDAETRAEEQQMIAEQRAKESRSRELGALSLLKVGQDPELAALLAIEAAKTAETDTAATALRTAIADLRIEAVIQEAGGASALAVSADGSTLAAGGRVKGGGEQAAWLTFRTLDDLMEDRSVPGFGFEAPLVGDLSIDPNGRFAAVSTNQGDVLILDVAQGGVVAEEYFPMVVRHAETAFSPDGDRLLVAGEQGVAWVEVGTWRVAAELPIPHSGSRWTDVAIDPAGRRVAISGASGTYLLDVTQDGHRQRLSSSAASSLSFDASGGRLAAALQGKALVWDLDTGRVQDISTEEVLALALSPDGSTLLTGSADGQAALWNVATGLPAAALIGHRDAIFGAAFNAAGTLAYTSGRDGSTRVWRVPAEIVPVTTDPVLDLSGDGSVIATYSAGRLTFLEGREGEPISSIAWTELGSVTSTECSDEIVGTRPNVRLSYDGTTALAVDTDGCLAAIDVAVGQPLWVHNLSPGTDTLQPDPEVWVSPDGERVLAALYAAAGARVAEIRLLEGGTGDMLWSEVTGTGLVYGADFGTGGQMFLAGRYGLLGGALYGVDEGEDRCQAQASARVNDVTAIASGGFALATATGVQAFDDHCEDLRIGQLTEQSQPALGIVYRHDGSVAATVSNDGAIRIWDGASGSQLGTVLGTEVRLAFSEDGDLVLAGSHGARRFACDVCKSIDGLLAVARERVTRELTPEERATYLGEAA